MSVQRPGLQLHVAVLAAQAAQRGGDRIAAEHWAKAARQLQQHCRPFDMTMAEVQATVG